MKLSRSQALLLAATLLWGILPVRLSAGTLYETAQEIEGAIAAWNLEEASRLLHTLPLHPEDPLFRYYTGRIAFYEARYEAVLKAYRDLEGLPPSFSEFVVYARGAAAIARDFHSVESEHFIFRYAPGKDAILPELGLPVLETALREIGRDLAFTPDRPIVVEVYPSSESFITVSSLSKAEVETSGTIAICKFNRLMLTTPRALARGYNWLDTLSHELTHYILVRKTGNRAPIWLQEGIAKFEEVRWRSERGGEISPALRSILAQALTRDEFVPFSAMHPSFAKLKSQYDGQLAFGEVVMLIDLLHARGGYPLLRSLLEEVAEGSDPIEALAARGFPSRDLLALAKARIVEKGYRVDPQLAVLPRKLKDPEATEEEEETIPEITDERTARLARLGDLLRDRGRYRAAIFEYRKAIGESRYFSPVLANKLALAYQRNGEVAKAERVLRESLTRYPEFSTTLVRLGLLLVGNGEVAEAIGVLRRAMAVNPFHPLVHEALARCYEAQGDGKAAEKHRKILEILASSSRPPER
ncbi:MAG: hypothetical protein D6812_11540 [Deltaproteobacteria bacterium]|nr:MAG: hypothetical protein D6812_11540 [Deltaproteobacteria bacterium]